MLRKQYLGQNLIIHRHGSSTTKVRPSGVPCPAWRSTPAMACDTAWPLPDVPCLEFQDAQACPQLSHTLPSGDKVVWVHLEPRQWLLSSWAFLFPILSVALCCSWSYPSGCFGLFGHSFQKHLLYIKCMVLSSCHGEVCTVILRGVWCVSIWAWLRGKWGWAEVHSQGLSLQPLHWHWVLIHQGVTPWCLEHQASSYFLPFTAITTQ